MPLVTKTLQSKTTSVLDNLVVAVVDEIGRYRVIGANDINALMGLDKMKDAVGCSDVTCAAEIGGALGVQFLLSGTVDVLGDDLILTLTLLDTREATAVARRKSRVPNSERAYYDAIDALVKDVFGAPHAAAAPAKEAPAQATATGRLRVTSEAPGRVIMDGRDVGERTPTILTQVAVGKHEIVVESGSRRGRGTVTVQSGVEVKLDIRLTETVTGHLRVESEPSGAGVWVDDKPIGPAPQLLADLPAGEHQVRVEAPSMRTYDAHVSVRGGETTTVRAVLDTPAANELGAYFLARGASYKDAKGTVSLTGFGLEYSRAHSPRFALRGRAGVLSVDYGSTIFGSSGRLAPHLFETDSATTVFVSVGEQLTVPLVTMASPIPSVAEAPIAFLAAADLEANLATGLGVVLTAGLRLFWLRAGLSMGMYQGTDDSDNPERTSGAPVRHASSLWYGWNAGFAFAF